MKILLTTEFIDNLPNPEKRLDIYDTEIKGLQLRVSPNGSKSFAVKYRAAGAMPVRKTLGSYPTITLARARKLAKPITGKAAEGIDVVAVEKKAKAEAERAILDRMDSLATEYFADAAIGTHRKNGRAKKPKELKREKDVWENWLKPVFGKRSVASIMRREVLDFVAKMTRIAASRGRKSHALISQLFSYAVLKDIVPANITFGIPVVIPDARERVLTDAEMRIIWRAFEQPADAGSNQSIAMALAQRFEAVTLQRIGQVLLMKWTDIDFAERLWKCPAGTMKKSRTHLVPLSDLALHLLNDAERMIGDATYVFASPATDESTPMRVDASSRAFERMMTRLGIDDAQQHDFRTTGTTTMAGKLDVSEFIAGKVLSHAKGGSGNRNSVTSVHYNMYEYLSEKTVALGKWGDYLTALVSESNVIPFPAMPAKRAATI